MGKVLALAILGVIAYVWFPGEPRKSPPAAQTTDPIAEMAARLKAEQERLHAEEDARGRSSQPALTPAVPAAKNWQFSDRGAVLPSATSPDDACARARNNVQVTGHWMRQGGTVYEKGSGKTLNHNESFDAAARNRQFIEDNCRGR